ncbi:MAG: response regulator [Candidatus Pacebacteria bacterium]|nr:response regulator [Candidatus Paceibacterota bacterium]
MRLLVVEDNQKISSALKKKLSKFYIVDLAPSANEALSLAFTNDYHAMIIDVGLPDKSGIELIKELRQEDFSTPVLILSGFGLVRDIEKGLAAGADDYLTKPFSWRELSARVKAVVRRQTHPQTPKIIEAGPIRLNTWNRSVLKQGQKIDLSRKETMLLECLLRNKGRIVSTQLLRDAAWDSAWSDSNTIQVHINRLRTKLSLGSKKLIQTVYGSGYIIPKQI